MLHQDSDPTVHVAQYVAPISWSKITVFMFMHFAMDKVRAKLLE